MYFEGRKAILYYFHFWQIESNSGLFDSRLWRAHCHSFSGATMTVGWIASFLEVLTLTLAAKKVGKYSLSF